MFYGESDKKEIKAWIKQSEDALRKELSALKTVEPSPEVVTLKEEVSTLRQELSTLKTVEPSPEVVTLKEEVSTLRQELSTLKTVEPSPEVVTLKEEVSTLRQELSALRTIEPSPELIPELTPEPTIEPAPEPTPEPTIEEKFFLPEQQDTFFNNERTKISAQLKQALNASDIEKYLATNPSEESKKLQKSLTNHLRDVKRFVDKLKLTDINNEELSEVVTAKYFKLFHRIIFNNMLVAINRGVKSSDEFYLGLLDKVNEYLSRCGIYTVNLKSGIKAEAEDYESIKPKTLKTDDKTLSGIISEIERLPYRINYLDRFGEKKFLQYAGAASIYKAV